MTLRSSFTAGCHQEQKTLRNTSYTDYLFFTTLHFNNTLNHLSLSLSLSHSLIGEGTGDWGLWTDNHMYYAAGILGDAFMLIANREVVD